MAAAKACDLYGSLPQGEVWGRKCQFLQQKNTVPWDTGEHEYFPSASLKLVHFPQMTPNLSGLLLPQDHLNSLQD